MHHAHTPWPIKFVFLSLPFSFSCVCVLTKDASTYLRFTLLGTSRSNGNGVGELIYALSSLFITANAYYDIQVTFQTVSMQISGGLVELLYGSVWMDGDIQLNSGKVPPPVPCPNTLFSGPFYGQATSTECEFGIICCRTASRLTTLQRMQCPKVSTQACACMWRASVLCAEHKMVVRQGPLLRGTAFRSPVSFALGNVTKL